MAAEVSKTRVDATRSHVHTPSGVPITLFATPEVDIERAALEQVSTLAGLDTTLRALPDVYGAGARVSRMVLTPDFHRGKTIPVGTVLATQDAVVPQAVGVDIGCGMRVVVTDLTRDDLPEDPSELTRRLRHVFFGGGRDIPMSPRQREALLQHGPWGLHETCADNAGVGLWDYYDPDQQLDDLTRVHGDGGFDADGVFDFGDYVRASGRTDGRDAHIGSVGGGNHFVEIQTVDALADGATAHAWGLREGQVVIMIHTGSLGFGQRVGSHFARVAQRIYPDGLAYPEHGFWPLPLAGPHAALGEAYLDAMMNAANFAFGNRLMLGLMATRCLSEVVGKKVASRLLHDVPHNLAWRRDDGLVVHRKGACPAPGPQPDRDGPFRYTGPPVIVPGSMGAPSFLLAGQGAEDALESASHGAGRALSRGKARRVDSDAYAREVSNLHVVGPVDPMDVRTRPELVAELTARLMEEAPGAYKPVTPIIETIAGAGIAREVARVAPWLTVKG